MDSEFTIPLSLLAIFIRICISFAPHSGYRDSPTYGDYEAQRHWQEVTVNLPLDEWYRNTTKNNISYWGLDYPPLTAFHSQAVGWVGQHINSTWVELHTSRGEESYHHKVFMRWSVVIAEILHLPLYFLLTPSSNLPALVLVAITPAQPLIDHGHFQYNCISLGLTLLAVLAMRQQRLYTSTALFSLALNYKQMSLYHALPFFFYILGPRYSSWRGISEIVRVGMVVIATFAICWFPFISVADHVLFRMFPFNRGLFEDKVATFWCSLSVIVKVKELFDRITLVRAALFLTLIAVLPSQILLFRKPTFHRFILALTNSALGFFLFSFHVHEKTILIPLTTALLLLSSCKNNNKHGGISLPVAWFIIIATFSMFPLLQRDGLTIMYVACSGLCLSVLRILLRQQEVHPALLSLFWASVVGCGILHVAEVALPPPARYPYLYPTLNALYSAAHFAGLLCYFNYLQITDQ